MTNYGIELAKIALQIKAIKLSPKQPFQWASGFWMPIYNDNRLLLSSAAYRSLVAEGFEQVIREKRICCDSIAGTSTAGISPGTTLADRLQVPFLYVRDKPKDHGLRNQIEGIDSSATLEGRSVPLVEDLVSTGGSSVRAVHALRNARAIVDHVLCIFDYGLEEAQQLFAEAQCRVHALLTYDVLLDVAKSKEYITGEEVGMLHDWRSSPFVWGEKNGFPRGGTMSFAEKWKNAVEKKNSILCVGLDPAEYGQRPDYSLPQGVNKLEWCLGFVEKIAPFAAAVKPNRNYVKDLSRAELKTLVDCIHAKGMIAIDDSKLADIGETNDAGFYHARQEGYDAVTYAPFPGNTKEAVTQAHAKGLGLIALVLMSNPEFEVIKNATIRGLKGFEYFAVQAAEYGCDGIVVGAPSPSNHVKDEEVRRVREIVGERLVLMPGVGTQGGEAAAILSAFGDNVIANVGRAILYASDPAKKAEEYRNILNKLRSK